MAIRIHKSTSAGPPRIVFSGSVFGGCGVDDACNGPRASPGRRPRERLKILIEKFDIASSREGMRVDRLVALASCFSSETTEVEINFADIGYLTKLVSASTIS
jgi:hypothetical protein